MELSVEIMEFVAVFNKLLFSVFACIYRWPEISDFGGLECRTIRAERCIDIAGFFPYRAIVDPTDTLDRIPTRKRCSNRMSRFIHYYHAESGKEIFQESD
jgi:hypothetical protein